MITTMQKGIGTIHILVILALLILAGSARYVDATTPQISPELQEQGNTLNIFTWKTYRNEQYEFEVRYPGFYEVLSSIPSKAVYLRDKKYNGSFEWPGLSFYFGQVAEDEFTGAKLFSIQDEKNEVIRIKFTRGSGSRVYASCTLYGDRGTINICNQILSTFKFIPLENQLQVSNTESKESVENTTPGGISPPLFRGLQWLVTLLIIGTFIFIFRPNIFKTVFSVTFAVISLALINNCFITDVALPQLCEYRMLAFPVFVFADPLGDFIRSATLRSAVMPIIVPLLSFMIWYIVGGILFAIYSRMWGKNNS